MKTTLAGVAAFALVALVSSASFAQNPGSGANAVKNDASKSKKQAAQRIQRFDKRMADQLNLSESQKTSIRGIQAETREKLLPIVKEEFRQIDAVLTVDQRKKLAELIAQRRKEMGATAGQRGGAGKGAKKPGTGTNSKNPGANF